MRFLKSPAVNSVAIWAALRTGFRTCRTTSQMINVIKNTRNTPANNKDPLIRSKVSISFTKEKTRYISYSPAFGIVIFCPTAKPGMF